MIPKPTLQKRKRQSGYIPASVKLAVIRRSVSNYAMVNHGLDHWTSPLDLHRGFCEGKNCPNRRGDWRGLTWAHRYKQGPPNKGMGGTKRVCTAEDVWRACHICHNLEDGHIKEVRG